MITKEQLKELLYSDETYRVERTITTTNVDKLQEAICAFANDLPDSKKNGYLILGAYDDGRLSGLKVNDELMKNIAALRSNGNILPVPTMSVEKFSFPEGDLLVAEVTPSLMPPHRYRGRTFIRIGPRRDIATEAEERILIEKRTAYAATFDAVPCFTAKISDIDVDYIKNDYLPKMIDQEVLSEDTRDIKEQMAAIHLYDLEHDCPTYAALILFGKNPRYYMPGAYVQFVHFAGDNTGTEILNERRFEGSLLTMLPKLESFIRDAIVTARPVPISVLREKTVYNYPYQALRELMMNACMHRDYQSNMPIRLYQYNDHIEIMNAGGLYGEARPENFPMVNDYRNPLVAEAMRGMKYVNMFNRGIKRVRELLNENNNPKPEFNVNLITVFQVVVGQATDDGEQIIPVKDDKKDDKKELSERQTIIVKILLENPSITIKELANRTGISTSTINREIEKINQLGVSISREGGKTYGKWIVKL